MHIWTLRCGFCKSGKTTLVKLVKRFNARQMQKCSSDCLLLASFSVVISMYTVTKEEEKTRNVNVYLLINSIACNELTTACRVWYLKSLKACKLLISYWLICQETRNEVEVNAPRLGVLGLFDFPLRSILVLGYKHYYAKMTAHSSSTPHPQK